MKGNVSVIIPMYNASATIVDCLESVTRQTYPVREVIVVDNRSLDDSVNKVRAMTLRRKRPYPVRIVENRENMGLLVSYVVGAKEAQSDRVVMMHSDSVLPTNQELARLVAPMDRSAAIVASCPKICHPERVWHTYNFWQKLLFAHVVGKEPHGLNGKFDCYRKDVFLSIASDWERRFGNTDEAGGEDWDLHATLRRRGSIAHSSARVEHLHYFSGQFRLTHLIQKRRHLAKSYGKLLRLSGVGLGWKGLGAFLFRPVLATGSLIPGVQLGFLPLLLAYSVAYSWNMFVTRETRADPRVLIIPLLNIFLAYAESYWLVKSYFKTRP